MRFLQRGACHEVKGGLPSLLMQGSKIAAFLCVSLLASSALGEDLSKATKGVILSTDCDSEICTSYNVEVSKKFIRFPIAKQLQIVGEFCARLDSMAEDYETEDGHPWAIQSCVFRYRGHDIVFQSTDGRALAEAWYVASLAALRDK